MAKDDYDVLVYKILLYYYAVLKRKVIFDNAAFDELISKAEISIEYLYDIIRMMQDEELIEGAVLKIAWGQDSLLANNLSDIRITAAGIRYLKDNSKMKEVGKLLSGVPGLVASLIGIVKP